MTNAQIVENQENSLGTPQTRRNPWRAFEESRYFSIALITPVLAFFILLNVIPTLWMIGLGFYDYSLMSPAAPEFIGIENFVDIYEDADLWGAFGRTFVFVLLAVSIQTVLGIALGFLFWGSTEMPGRRVALTLLFTPMVLTPVASGLFWRLIYEPTFGIVNYFITSLGGDKIDFLTNVDWAFGAVLFVDIWMWTPFMILMTLAALGSVPKAELEAAEIDRLSWWKQLRYVIFPHGKFILMLGILLRTIDAFKTTDLVFLMTNGGPGNVTELIGLKLYRFAFASLDLGFSSALAVILLLIAIAFTSIYLYILNLSQSSTQGEQNA
ncbi:MAG: sugar ABC transporter permease [Chloroflexota bacterium]